MEEEFALLAAQLFPNVINAQLILFAQYVRLAIKETSAIHVLPLITNRIVHLLLAVLALAPFPNATSARIVSLVLNAW